MVGACADDTVEDPPWSERLVNGARPDSTSRVSERLIVDSTRVTKLVSPGDVE